MQVHRDRSQDASSRGVAPGATVAEGATRVEPVDVGVEAVEQNRAGPATGVNGSVVA